MAKLTKEERILKGVQDCLNHGSCMDCPYANKDDCKGELVGDIIYTIRPHTILGNNAILTAAEANKEMIETENNDLFTAHLFEICDEIKRAIKRDCNSIEIQVTDNISERICRYFQLLQYNVVRLAWTEGVTKIRIGW